MQPTLLCSVFLMSAAVQAAVPAVTLTQEPLVMRMSKDEFRIAFGIRAGHCSASGCYGVIRYRVSWRAEDGSTGSDVKQAAPSSRPSVLAIWKVKGGGSRTVRRATALVAAPWALATTRL
jgi:hypothetical protein